MSVDLEICEKDCSRWWENENLVDCRISGVFEGGGAKGVLYAGALRAVLKEHCWFDAVAGASAGAITATLIAAGLTPDDIVTEMDGALDTLRKPKLLNGILRVREGASALDQEALLVWLTGLLERRIEALCGKKGFGNITFDQLYKATEIELNVVAVDLRRERPIVFNRQLTGKCQVAHAVVASAAIPVMFEWMPLIISKKLVGVVVDGGVAANFPMFVFTNKSFRKWAELPEHHSMVVGFLLDEGEDPKPDEYHNATFSEPLSHLKPDKWGPPKFKPKPEKGSIAKVLLTALLLPFRIILWPFVQFFFNVLPWLAQWNAAIPQPLEWMQKLENKLTRQIIQSFDRVLAGVQPWGLFLAAFVVVTGAFGYSLYDLVIREWLVPLIGELSVGDVSVLSIGIFLMIVFSIATILYAWVVLIVLFGTASILHQSVRLTGYGLIRTFLKGPGAPPWTGKAEGDNVIRIKVPDGITMLEVDTNKIKFPDTTEKVEGEVKKEIQELVQRVRKQKNNK